MKKLIVIALVFFSMNLNAQYKNDSLSYYNYLCKYYNGLSVHYLEMYRIESNLRLRKRAQRYLGKSDSCFHLSVCYLKKQIGFNPR